MKTSLARSVAILLVLLGAETCARATVRYVNLNNPTPASPYTSWANAATNIQQAVDVALAGDEIVVTNGIYATSGRVVTSGISNRLAVTKAVVVRSVNGPDVTVIRGYHVPGTTNGLSAVRCVYLASGATLSGFTLANGATWPDGYPSNFRNGGGIWCASTTALVSNCVITANSAQGLGGGVFNGTLVNCELSRNIAVSDGGGAFQASLTNCTLFLNRGAKGGGATFCNLTQCSITDNQADAGGGAYGSTLRNCLVARNTASSYTSNLGGGGANSGTLVNCTVTGNSAKTGGGTSGSTLNNCIIYYNTASTGPNVYLGSQNYCCTTPLPSFGTGNIDADPQLASLSHLSEASPCRGAGSSAYTSGVDLDGEPWGNPPSMGCDELDPAAALGDMNVRILTDYTNVAPGFALGFAADISGRLTSSRWEFGGGVVLSNRPYVSYSWAVPGDYPVVLRGYNASYPDGLSATVTVHVVTQPMYYVSLNSVSPAAPYASWATAATNIQSAVDSVSVAGALVLVSNGVYRTGGRVVQDGPTNRVVVTKPITLQSLNGPEVTVIQGYRVPGSTNGNNAVRCVYLADRASLVGFTLTNGATLATGDPYYARSGGGVFCASTNATISDCVLAGNSAYSFGGGVFSGTLVDSILATNSSFTSGGGSANSIAAGCLFAGNSANFGGAASSGVLTCCRLIGNTANTGGGAAFGQLQSCAVVGNCASSSGGGSYYGNLNNCTLTLNSASTGGGANLSTLRNCLVYYNLAPTDPNYSGGTLTNCCTTPLPAPDTGSNNLEAEPQLADSFHLSADSPCIGAGNSAFAAGTDLDGDSWANPPAIGCDEFYADASGALSVAIQASDTNVAPGFAIDFNGMIEGHASVSWWDFGDGTVVSNRPGVSHAWSTPGDYPVTLHASNQDNPGGVVSTMMVRISVMPAYVALNNSTPLAPYTSWATAATNIQDAVDAAPAGGLVFVSNGVYSVGQRTAPGTLPNRVAVTRPLTLQSVNGPALTTIQGRPTMGASAIRCVYLTSGASLIGFTLASGATLTTGNTMNDQSGGGVLCETGATLSNCVLTANSAVYGGGCREGMLTFCVLTNNSAYQAGAGAYGGTLDHCTLSGNSTTNRGGGAFGGSLSNCLLAGNSAREGGGAFTSFLSNCTITNNSASFQGGGAGQATVLDCLFTSNSAPYGGGAAGCGLGGCAFVGNSATFGGGSYYGDLTNCTLTGNFASDSGGGTHLATLKNSLIYYNEAPAGANCSSSPLDYCCTFPPTSGTGNLDTEPQLASVWRLGTGSPCFQSGNPAYASGLDLDGEPWANPPSIGCDEPNPAFVTGPIQVAFQASHTNVITGFTVSFVADIPGAVSDHCWEFGDGTIVSNRLQVSHAWTNDGLYDVVLRAFNADHPAGVTFTVSVRVVSNPVQYVALDNPTPLAPYDSWATAATRIQDAVDAAPVGGLVLVSNGVYAVGGRVANGPLTNRVAVTKELRLESVNGPDVTVVRGYQVPSTVFGGNAVRCVYLTNGATLVGFTLTNGATMPYSPAYESGGNQRGGGVYSESGALVMNCIIAGNAASYVGGGASGGVLRNCVIRSNRCSLAMGTSSWGGGAYFSTLINCTLVGNSSWSTAADECALRNCILYNNPAIGGNYDNSTLDYCCTTPLPSGSGNIDLPPLFVDEAGGNLRLQSGSPCINTGNNAYVQGNTDLDGRPRITDAAVDMGAYEYQGSALASFVAWLQQYGLPPDSSSDYADPDLDGSNNWQEWIAGTDPTNSWSVLRMLAPAQAAPGWNVSWQSVNTRTYFLERSISLSAHPAFVSLQSNIVGQSGVTTFADITATNAGPVFYRVGVRK